MPHKLIRMQRAEPGPAPARPVMLAIAGDSAAGKTTVTRGLVEALGADRCTAVCVDDYHRYDRAERRDLGLSSLHADQLVRHVITGFRRDHDCRPASRRKASPARGRGRGSCPYAAIRPHVS